MEIAITGPTGSGKTTLAAELARKLGLRHVEPDALHHDPNWESCGPDVLRERLLAATEGGGWVTDSTYTGLLGDFLFERAETPVWLDRPVPLVVWRLIRRTYLRRKHRIELWNGNVEGPWRESWGYLIKPAFQIALSNRRTVPERVARHPHLRVHRLRSDREVREFVRSIKASDHG